MTDYLVQMKSLTDSLKSSSEDVSESYLVDFIIASLGTKFINILHNLHFQLDLIFNKIIVILIQEEILLKQLHPSYLY